MTPLQRIAPILPVTAFQTYEIIAPLSTHHRVISCEEAGCQAWRHGWKSLFLNPGSDIQAKHIKYITERSGRRYTVARYGDDGLWSLEFTFMAGQTCFQRHYVLDREPTYIRWGGDWRGRTDDGITHTRPEHWVEDFADHQSRIALQVERG